MRTLILFLLFSSAIFAQESKYKTVLGCKIEIDGHIFDNKKSKDPIKFEADLNGITISDSKKQYEKRNCEIKECDILHLKEKHSGILKLSQGWNMATKTNALLLTN